MAKIDAKKTRTFVIIPKSVKHKVNKIKEKIFWKEDKHVFFCSSLRNPFLGVNKILTVQFLKDRTSLSLCDLVMSSWESCILLFYIFVIAIYSAIRRTISVDVVVFFIFHSSWNVLKKDVSFCFWDVLECKKKKCSKIIKTTCSIFLALEARILFWNFPKWLSISLRRPTKYFMDFLNFFIQSVVCIYPLKSLLILLNFYYEKVLLGYKLR